jgi:hypothetical protein
MFSPSSLKQLCDSAIDDSQPNYGLITPDDAAAEMCIHQKASCNILDAVWLKNLEVNFMPSVRSQPLASRRTLLAGHPTLREHGS